MGRGGVASEARDRAEAMLELLGLARKMHLRPAELSGGEKQRVAIGRALIKKPQLLFADEPTSALDWDHGEQVIELLRTAAHDTGATVLCVAHDARIVPYADKVFYLEDGRLQDNEELGRDAGKSPAARHSARCRAETEAPDEVSPDERDTAPITAWPAGSPVGLFVARRLVPGGDDGAAPPTGGPERREAKASGEQRRCRWRSWTSRAACGTVPDAAGSRRRLPFAEGAR